MERNQDIAKVGEILVGAGLIDDMQLASALGEQKRWGRRLGITLVKLGMVSESDLIRALAHQLGLPVASVAGKRIPPEVVALVPSRVAFEHGVLPLFLKPGELTAKLFLGMEDPSNLAVLEDLSFRTGLEIQPVMVGPTELAAAIDRFYLRAGERTDEEKELSNETLGELNLRRLGPDASPPEMVIASEHELTAEELYDLGSESDAGSDQEVVEGPEHLALPLEKQPMPPVNPAVGTDSESLKPLAPIAPAAGPVSQNYGMEPLAPKALPPLDAEGEPVSSQERIEALEEAVQRAEAETEKTRAVIKAMMQILHERGLLPFEVLQQRIAKMKAVEPED